jgi:hypothetical protein
MFLNDFTRALLFDVKIPPVLIVVVPCTSSEFEDG